MSKGTAASARLNGDAAAAAAQNTMKNINIHVQRRHTDQTDDEDQVCVPAPPLVAAAVHR